MVLLQKELKLSILMAKHPLYEITDDLLKKFEDLAYKEDEDLSFEENNERGELFYEVKEQLEEASLHLNGIDYKKLYGRFRDACSQFETPEEIEDATLNDMFPDEGSDEGFDIDDFFGNHT